MSKAKDFNAEARTDREVKLAFREEGWHTLLFKGPHTPVTARCPKRQHIVQITPAQALSDGCPTCNLMDAPPEDVKVKVFKADVKRQDAKLLKSIERSRSKARRGGRTLPSDRYAI